MNILISTEAAAKAVRQKYGPNYTITVIEDVPVSRDHAILIVSMQHGRDSKIVIVNMLKTNRGYQIQIYEQVSQCFLPS